MEETINSSITVALLLLASSSYCHLLVSKLPKGVLRIVFIVPILYLNCSIPWYFQSILLRGLSSGFISWITNFKLLLFCFDRGPLVTNVNNYLDFFAISICPLKVKEKPPQNPASTFQTLLIMALLTLPLAANFYIYKQKYALLFHALSVLILLFVLTFFGAPLGRTLARYEPVPIFNKPYKATSLQDFWGRRWNLMASHIMRLLIYFPTRDSLSGLIGFSGAKVVALISSLVVSGVMHELMFYHMTCAMKPDWEVTSFFALQGFGMAFESAAKSLFKARGWRQIDPAGSTFLTLSFVVLTGYWMLVRPVMTKSTSQCDMKSKGIYFLI